MGATAGRGEAKTDVRDAYVIAETTCHLNDFTTIDMPVRWRPIWLLTAHRPDLVAGRVRMTNRLRDVLTGSSPLWSGPSTTTP